MNVLNVAVATRPLRRLCAIVVVSVTCIAVLGVPQTAPSNGSRIDGSTTTQLPALKLDANPVAAVPVPIAAGEQTSLAVTSSGTVMSWGYNFYGQLGNGTTNTTGCACNPVPSQIPGLTGVVAVVGGYDFNFALKSDGTLWGFGVNNEGQLGNGTLTNSSTPVQVPGLSGVIAAAASYGTGYAVELDGSLWAWGRNDAGQVGNGQQNLTGCLCVQTPVKVSGIQGSVVSVSASGLNVIALTSDGTLWTWGDDGYGEAGNGQCLTGQTGVLTPYHLPSPIGITAIAASTAADYALASDGTIWDWGANGTGQLGRFTPPTCGQQNLDDLPGQIPTLSGVGAIAATNTGGSPCCDTAAALLSNGTVVDWGNNSDCQLGNGNSTSGFAPVSVQNLSGAVAIASGDGYSIAERSDGSIWAWGDDSKGSLGDGTTGPFATTCGDPNAPMTAIPTQVSGIAPARPSAPLNISASTVTTSVQAASTVSVSWTAPVTSGGSPIASYTIYALQSGSVVTGSTVNAPATSVSLTVTSTCTVSTVIEIFATSAAGQGPAGFSSAFVDVRIPSSPAVVVILMPGDGGSGPQDSYDPSSFANYCGLATGGQPAITKIASLSFDHSGNPSPNFTDAVAALGAVILPFSYTGSYFAGPTSASFTVNSYVATDAGRAPAMSAPVLDKEIKTVHAVYPNALVYVGGDSGAGAVEVEWYGGEPSQHDYGFYSSVKYPYIGGIFTMDSPINGFGLANVCIFGCPWGFNGFSQPMVQDMARRWKHLDENSQAYEVEDSGLQAVFSPIGTEGDLIYVVADPDWDGIHSQYMCAHGSSTRGPCGPESLDFSTPEPPYPPYTNPSEGPTASHDWLFSQAAVINYFSGAIKAGGLNANATDPAEIRGSLSTNVAAPGQTLTITGSGGFGTATGQITFTAPSNQTVQGAISSWNDTSIVVTVPSTAVTGVVLGMTAGGVPFYAGGLAVEPAANGVAQLTYQPIVTALSGQAETLTVTATDASGAGVANAVISLTDGIGTISCTANASGVCSLSVAGYQSQTFTLLSGTTAIQVPFTWNQPPVQVLSMSASPTILLNGASTTITVTVTDSSGNPVANQQVSFDSSGTASVTLSASQAATNSSGVATITATSTTSGVAQVEAITDDSTAEGAVQLSWANATVTGVSPVTGPSAGGTTVTISGTGFTSSATVYFGTHPASSTTFVNATSLTAASPAGSGAVDVRVGVGGSYSDLSPSDLFTYIPPTVTSVSPSSGPATGGTKVTISGTNFAPGAQVKFGSTASSNIQVTSTTSITAFAPPVAAGTVDVTVTVAGSTSTTSSADQFTFTAVTTPPTVTQVTPTTGPAAGGTLVTVTGTNFVGGSTVSVGGSAGTNVNVQTSTTLTFTTPAGTGTVDVRVTTPAGTSPAVAADQFTYQAPAFPGMVAAGWFHNLAAKTDGTVWAWGRNNFGQLGNGTTTQSNVPVQVSNFSGAIGVAGGSYHSVALKSDGTVWAWGYNGSGQLGNGTTTNSSTPVQVSPLVGITAVAAGCNFTIALKSDGTVWDWGDNGYGQLGNGTTTNSSRPVQVSGLSGVTAIGGGCDHALALKADGTVWTWGDNHNGQLGNGTTTNASKPVKVSNLANVVSISGGEFHSLAAKSDGTAWSWGYNQNGQLGNGTTKQSTTPVQVSGLTNVKLVAGGGGHSLALTSTGAIWAWGLNSYGQLGNGKTTNSTTPVQVSNLSTGVMISGGVDHSIATTTAGLAWDWGNNQFGQLGNGTTSNSSIPVQVSNLTSV